MKHWFLVTMLFALMGIHPAINASPAQTTAANQIRAVDNAVINMVANKELAGAVVLVSHKGRTIHFKAYGHQDIEDNHLMKTDSIFRIYSMTKPLTSLATLILAEEGLVDLDAPISDYIPEFKGSRVHGLFKTAPAQTPITTKHLLTHTAGLTYGFFSNTAVDKRYNKNHPLWSSNNQEFISKLTKHPLLYEPGKQWHYSVATDVLGHLIERVSGKQLGVFLEERIFKPLKMTDTSFHIENSKINRFASSYGAKRNTVDRFKYSVYKRADRIQSGGGGLISTASDYLRFCQLILNGGELNGLRLVSRKTIREMTQNQLPKGVYAYTHFGFGYGFMVQPSNWGNRAKKGEISWNGAASTHFWITPSEQLIVIALSQRQPYSNRLKKTIKPIIYKQIAKP